MIFPDWLGSYGEGGVEIIFGEELGIELEHEEIGLDMAVNELDMELEDTSLNIEMEA